MKSESLWQSWVEISQSERMKPTMVLQATAILISISRDNSQRSLAIRYIEYRKQKCSHLLQTHTFQYFRICKHEGISVQIFHGAISWNVGVWCFHNIRQVCVIHTPLQPTDFTVTQTLKKDKAMLLASYMRYPRYPASVSVLPKLCCTRQHYYLQAGSGAPGRLHSLHTVSARYCQLAAHVQNR